MILAPAPVAGDPDGFIVTRVKLAELGEYILDLQNYAAAARACLEVK